MRDLFIGPVFLLQGFRLLARPGLRRFVMGPLLVNLVLFAGLLYQASDWIRAAVGWLLSRLPDFLQWLGILLVPLFWLLALVVVFYSFSLIANFIGAPFNGLLAEAVEAQLGGRTSEVGWKAVLKDVPQALAAELRKLVYFGLRALPLLLLMWIPVVNVPAGALWLLFSAWMMCIQYMDYPMGNHRLFFADQRACLRRRPLLAWSFGAAVMLATLVPVVNFAVMPAAVVGATLLWVRELKPS
ncbi:MAG TPA: sulfate transporter CysZ [Gammaproteobacteria bacterium]|nr:sulfate transporter CysZ [Gammaproteobacteria bacterium]